MKEYYKQEEVWDTLTPPEEERIKNILSLIPEDADSVLDVGCGNGRLTNRLKGFKEVVGIDECETPLKYVKCKKILGKCDAIPFQDKSFDLILATEVFEHLDNKIYEGAKNEIQRVARRYILISVPYKERPYETFVKCKNCSMTYSPYSHQRYFDKGKIQKLFSNTKQTIKFVGAKKSAPILRRIGQIVFDNYEQGKNCICPGCKSRETKYEFNNKISELYSGFLWRFVRHFGRKKPNWILCLYEFS